MTRMIGTIKSKMVFDEILGRSTRVLAYFLDGEEVTKEEFDAAFPSRLEEILGTEVGTNCRPGCWPMKSRSLAIHPSQVGEGNEFVKDTGCHYDRDGSLVIPDQAAKKRVLKKRGATDLSSFN